MGVKDGSGVGGGDDRQVEEGFRRRFAFPANHLSIPIHNDQISLAERSLVDTARGHQQSQWFWTKHGAEVSTRAVTPAALMDEADHLAKGGGFREQSMGGIRGQGHHSGCGGLGAGPVSIVWGQQGPY
jgi:hypothetical protein